MVDAIIDLIGRAGEGADRACRQARPPRASIARMTVPLWFRQVQFIGQQDRGAIGVPQSELRVDLDAERRVPHALRPLRPALERPIGRTIEREQGRPACAAAIGSMIFRVQRSSGSGAPVAWIAAPLRCHISEPTFPTSNTVLASGRRPSSAASTSGTGRNPPRSRNPWPARASVRLARMRIGMGISVTTASTGRVTAAALSMAPPSTITLGPGHIGPELGAAQEAKDHDHVRNRRFHPHG